MECRYRALSKKEIRAASSRIQEILQKLGEGALILIPVECVNSEVRVKGLIVYVIGGEKIQELEDMAFKLAKTVTSIHVARY